MRVGSKILCVDDAHRNEFKGLAFKQWVTKGKTYTVRELVDNDDIVKGVLLEEVSNPQVYIPVLGRFQEPAFLMDRFRDVEEQEQEEMLEILQYVN